MKMSMFTTVLAFVLTSGLEGCDFSSLLGDLEDDTEVVDNSTYTYRYTCPVGSSNSIQIPNRLSATCKANWEYFARTYGCNDADNFAKANALKAQCP